MRNKTDRPEWFKFWRRNRRQLDIELLSMDSRGVVFTNMMRYFDEDEELIPMSDLEAVAFNVVKINVDDSFCEYEERKKINEENGKKGGRPPKTEAKQKNRLGYFETEKTRVQSTEDRRQSTEGRGGTTAAKPRRAAFVPPRREEVRAYCRQRQSNVDPDRFFDYFDAGGWADAKGEPVRNWKQKLLTWEHKEPKSPQPSAQSEPDLSWRTARPAWEEGAYE